jgi:hypothetical protein
MRNYIFPAIFSRFGKTQLLERRVIGEKASVFQCNPEI